jgi:hypothetical protein
MVDDGHEQSFGFVLHWSVNNVRKLVLISAQHQLLNDPDKDVPQPVKVLSSRGKPK